VAFFIKTYKYIKNKNIKTEELLLLFFKKEKKRKGVLPIG
jgi:hypothetical protein